MEEAAAAAVAIYPSNSDDEFQRQEGSDSSGEERCRGRSTRTFQKVCVCVLQLLLTHFGFSGRMVNHGDCLLAAPVQIYRHSPALLAANDVTLFHLRLPMAAAAREANWLAGAAFVRFNTVVSSSFSSPFGAPLTKVGLFGRARVGGGDYDNSKPGARNYK